MQGDSRRKQMVREFRVYLQELETARVALDAKTIQLKELEAEVARLRTVVDTLTDNKLRAMHNINCFFGDPCPCKICKKSRPSKTDIIDS